MHGSPGKLAVLVVGSLPPPLGGCTVTLQHLVDALRARPDVDVRVIDTSGIRGRGAAGAARLASVAAQLARAVRSVDVVSLHVATTALPEWGAVVEATARAAGRPFVLRKFADTDYLRLGAVRGRLAHFVAAHADLYLAETRRHLEEVKARGIERARWFPTARPLRRAAPPRDVAAGGEAGAARRFVYLGHLTREKGIAPLVEAMRGAPAGVTLDLYGRRFPEIPAALLEGDVRLAWRGEVPASAVPDLLSRYDVLVLPTIASTEGYPGAIVEAYAAGLPVIASRIGGIPELVDGSAGILVEPGDVTALRDAIARFATDATLFRRLRAASLERGKDFSTQRWAGEFVESCRELAS